MPMGSVTLRPGVDVEQTPSLNEAGIAQSQIIRFKNGLIQPMGGWMSYGTAIPSTVRDLHAWQDIAHLDHLSAAGTANVVIISSGPSKDITPQTFTTNPAPNFSTIASSFAVTVVDANSGPSLFNTVFFNTPISIDGLLLNGAYQVTSVLSTGSYIIQSSVPATAGVLNSGVTPTFQTSGGSPIVTVIEPYNNFQSIIGLSQAFYAPTNVGGLTIHGSYSVTRIINPSSTFTITAPTQATSNASVSMNGGNAQLVYYVTG